MFTFLLLVCVVCGLAFIFAESNVAIQGWLIAGVLMFIATAVSSSTP
jgi:hypothetical protein